MELNDYQQAAGEHAIYPNRGANLPYVVLGLCGEAGELANALKKVLRAGREVSAEDNIALADEAGDVAWYLSQVAYELGWDLAEVCRRNLDKLARRRAGREDGRGQTAETS